MVDNPAADKYSVPVERIFQIHKSPCKVVLAITGGGAEIIGELLRHGSGSATVLDAFVPYSTDAMDRFLGRKPEKYCSEKTARLMAMVAYQRALDLSKGGGSADPEMIGIGATCKLKAANEREGRKHEIHVAIQAACETGVCTLELTADRTREEEEKIAALLIFNVLARHCGVPEIDFLDRRDTGTVEGETEEVIERYAFASEPVGDLLKPRRCSQESPYNTLGMERINLKDAKTKEAKVTGENRKIEEPKETDELEKIRLVFPGSFDPCHRNHLFMAKMASEKLGEPVHFEISLANVDKPPIDFISLNQRLDSLRIYKNENFMGGICLTNAPLFLQKADLFPNSTFIIGADTFNRLFNVKYYGGAVDTSAILKLFKEKNIRFMVFHRKSTEFCINPDILEFCEIVPIDEYEDDGTSSTEIRRKCEK
jgi:nicotinic acid mononucleotide adenylyltransferase